MALLELRLWTKMEAGEKGEYLFQRIPQAYCELKVVVAIVSYFKIETNIKINKIYQELLVFCF